ncbi:MAG: sulfatase family protein, partial [Candidatus Binatia bacterium]
SPNVEKLAKRGVRFAQASAPMPTTDPSHVSLFTGLHPRTHGVVANGMKLPESSLASLFTWAKAKGWATGAFVSRAHVNPWDLNLGSVDFVSGPEGRERRGDETLATAREWIAAHSQQPFLAWVHFFDPHGPYDPPKDFTEASWRPAPLANVERARQFQRRYSKATTDHLIALYDTEIRYADSLVGSLVAQIEALPPLDAPTLWIVASDHGETMTELMDRYGYAFDHGEFLYQGQLHVALVVTWPGRLPAGKVVETPVGLVDVAATVTELVDGASAFPTEGQSLAGALVRGEPVKRGPLFFERKQLAADIQTAKLTLKGGQYALRIGNLKFIENEGGTPELYDLAADPGETRNLAPSDPQVVGKLVAELNAWKTRSAERNLPLPSGEKLIEDLRALGYVQ